MKAKIISASRRTDIPAFYADWFVHRIREGFCMYPNPLYPQKFYQVSLRRDDVLGFVFWTRHARPLFPYLSELDRRGFPYYFHYTIVGYPRTLDPGSPSLDVAMRTLCDLSSMIGKERIIWRYDPLIFNNELNMAWHQDNFRRIADHITGFTNHLVISVIDPYIRTQRRVGSQDDGVDYHPRDYMELLQWIVDECASRSISIQTCAESSLEVAGITRGSCVDTNLLHTITGQKPPSRVKFHKQRDGCLCHQSTDIGVNDTCGFGCKYCYATLSHTKAQENIKRHQSYWTCMSQDVPVNAQEKESEQLLLFEEKSL